MRRFGLIVAAVAVASSGVLATSASAAPGDITFVDCIADDGLRGCTDPSLDPLLRAWGVAVSPDGTSVYVTAGFDDSLSHFTRAPNGSIAFAGCIADDGRHGCIDPAQDALNQAEGIAISPDGTSIYVASSAAGSVSHFTRAPNGDVTLAGCVANSGGHGCANPAVSAMYMATDVAVSPDGQNVYVTAAEGDSISWFTRLPGGSITFAGCIAENGKNGCVDPSVDTLVGAQGVVISPDGTSVYVVSGDEAVSHFVRAANGDLTFAGCIANPNPFAVGCTDAPTDSLFGAREIAISPDGSSLYVTSQSTESLTHLTRAPDGSIAYAGCTANNGRSGCVDPFLDPLNGASGVEVSPDGRYLYVVAEAGSVSQFVIGAGGTPSLAGCIAYTLPLLADLGCVKPSKDALGVPRGVAVSPSGDSVYVTSAIASSVSQFGLTPPEPPVLADTTPPETAKGKGPKKTVKSKKPKAKITFAFSSPEPSVSFECSLDGANASGCTSPTTVKIKAKRKAKKHTFAVAAIDAAGNTDSSPIEFAFKVKRKR